MNDDELQHLLQANDPASSLPPASPDWVARLVEETMSTDPSTEPGSNQSTDETRETGTRNRSPLTWLVAAAAAVLIAGVGVFGLANMDRESSKVPTAGSSQPVVDDPTVTEIAAGPSADTKCMVPNAEFLSNAQLAFSGTVRELGDDVVVLVPDRFYTGEATDLVEVRSPSALLQAMISAVDFEVGQRYLVSANDGQVRVCGFSGLYTPELATLYDAAFPG